LKNDQLEFCVFFTELLEAWRCYIICLQHVQFFCCVVMGPISFVTDDQRIHLGPMLPVMGKVWNWK